MKINEYQKAMFGAYWLPVLLFFLLPNIAITLVASNVTLSNIVIYVLSFPLLVFTVGFIVAPYFGRRTKENGINAFIMAYICLGVSLSGYLLLIAGPQLFTNSYTTGIFIMLAIFGLIPALVGGAFFLGACRKI